MDGFLLTATFCIALYGLGMTLIVVELMRQRQMYRDELSRRRTSPIGRITEVQETAMGLTAKGSLFVEDGLAHIRRLEDNIPICLKPEEWDHFVRVDPYVPGFKSCKSCDLTIESWKKIKA